MSEEKKKAIFTNKLLVILLPLCCQLLWSSAMPAIKVGYAAFGITGDSPVSVKLFYAGLRFFLAGCVVMAMTGAKEKKFPMFTKAQAPRVVIFSLLQITIQYMIYYIGISRCTGTLGSILVSCSSFFVVLVSPLLFKSDRYTAQKLLGVVLGFAGIVVSSGISDIHFTLTGEGFVLISGIVSAASALASRKFSETVPPSYLTSWSLFLGGGILLLIGIFGGGSLPVVTVKGVLVLLYLAMVSVVAFSLWNNLLKYNEAGRICIFSSLGPVTGSLMCFFILGERFFNWQFVVALVLVVGGVFLVNANLGKKAK